MKKEPVKVPFGEGTSRIDPAPFTVDPAPFDGPFPRSRLARGTECSFFFFSRVNSSIDGRTYCPVVAACRGQRGNENAENAPRGGAVPGGELGVTPVPGPAPHRGRELPLPRPLLSEPPRLL